MQIEECASCSRRDEEFVRLCIARVLGVPVCAHDDGRRASMYDLVIRYPDRVPAPVEVTSDVDERAAGTLNTLDKMYGQDAWDAPSLERSWSLQTVVTPNLRQLKAHAEAGLRALELAGLTEFESQVHRWGGRAGGGSPVGAAAEALAACGVERAVSSPGQTEPKIRVYPMLGGGSWDGSAECVVAWIDAFVAAPRCADNLRKLAVPGAMEGHLAVYAHMTAAPWPVWRALVDHYGTQVVPAALPTLPAPVTHLWLLPSPGESTGLAYDPGRGWFRFDAPEPTPAGG
jgi:hypothetical protein